MRAPDDLPAHLDGPAVGEAHRLDPAADAVAGLEHDDVGPGPRQVTGRAQSGQPGTQHRHIGHASPPFKRIRTSPA